MIVDLPDTTTAAVSARLVRLRADTSRLDEMALDTASTKTTRVRK